MRRARLAAERAAADQERGRFRPPDRRDCVERSWYQSLDDTDTMRLDHRLYRADGRLVDFALIVIALQLDGAWREVARVDCCHGHVHLHHEDGTVSSIGPLHHVADVAEHLDAALVRLTAYAVTIRDMRGSDD